MILILFLSILRPRPDVEDLGTCHTRFFFCDSSYSRSSRRYVTRFFSFQSSRYRDSIMSILANVQIHLSIHFEPRLRGAVIPNQERNSPRALASDEIVDQAANLRNLLGRPQLHQRGININGRLTVHYPEILEGCEDAMDDTATQPSTQPLADPNGQHRSNVFDRELRDVICILHPTSEAAHKSVKKVAHASPQHILQNEHLEEGFTDAGRILQARNGVRSRPSYDIALRLSSKVLDIKMGFWFGRNPHRTDVFLSDPESKGARISNNHFRIYLTDEGIIMLEDNSTNGTCVDGYHLRNRPTLEQPVYSQSRALQHGSVITLVAGSHDEIKFIVQCPNRYEQRQNYEMEFARYCEVRQQEVQKAVAAQKLRDGLVSVQCYRATDWNIY
jgi:hypothetical protein